MLNAIIIDDEPNSRELLTNMLTHFCEGVQVSSTAMNVANGIEQIKTHSPDVVFLDIEMPDGTGFDLLQQIDHQSLTLIFVTGYHDYAIRAIKYAALDYLLKPVDLGELRAAVRKAKERHLSSATTSQAQLILHEQQHHTVIPWQEILYLEANGNYVTFHLTDERTKLASHPLQYYEQNLPAAHFFRIHKSHLINLKQVERYDGGRTGSVYLKNGAVLDIAARRKSAFVQAMRDRK